VRAVNNVASAANGILVLRSHGVSPAVIQAARERGLQVVDATCPHVSKAQQAARELKEQGYMVIVVGEQGHPEVEAIRDWAGAGTLVVQEPADLPDWLQSNSESNSESKGESNSESKGESNSESKGEFKSASQLAARIGLVVQTTQSPAKLELIVAALQQRGIQPEVRNTICSATRQRQEAAAQLAATVNVMLVVGGRNSANTTRLTEICASVCPATYHIETPAEISPTWFQAVDKVGITAGASTPESQISAVVAQLKALP
jgi:4-hydroxy-3-methylbut-2-enyl diphosphate reductase